MSADGRRLSRTVLPVAFLLWCLGFSGAWLATFRAPAMGLTLADAVVEPLVPAICLVLVQFQLAHRSPPAGTVRLVNACYLLITWGWLLQARVDVGSARSTSVVIVVASLVMVGGIALGRRVLDLEGEDLQLAVIISAGAAILIIVATAFVAPTVRGSRTTVDVGLAFQPGELARILLVLAAAGIVAQSVSLGSPTKSARVRLGLLAAFACGALLWLQRDFSPALLLLIVLCALLWLHHGRGYLATAAVLGTTVLLALSLLLRNSLDGRGRRFRQWWDPYSPLGDLDGGLPSQLGQGLLAYRRGGLFGAGWGLGHPQTVPLSQSDFILVVAAEELGSLGLLFVLVGAVVVAVEGWRIVARMREGFHQLFAAGLVLVLVVSWLLTIAGTFGLLPHGGLAVPFLSRGGSSLMASALIIGLLAGIGSDPRVPARPVPLAAKVERPSTRAQSLAGRRGLVAVLALVVLLQFPLPGPDRIPHVGHTSSAKIEAAAETVDRDFEQSNLERGRILAADGTVLAETLEAGDDSCPTPLADLASQPRRCYPEGPMYSDVVGALERVDPKALEDVLAGYLDDCVELTGSSAESKARRLVGRDCRSHPDVKITLEPRLQKLAFKALDGREGMAIVMDPRTGDVRALASSRTYDPGTLVARSWERGAAAQDPTSLPRRSPQPVGSITKLLTVAAALEAGRGEPVTEAEARDTVLPGESICWGSVRTIVAESCNRGAAALGERVGPEAIDELAESLWFGMDETGDEPAERTFDGLGMGCSPLPMATRPIPGCIQLGEDRFGRRAAGLAYEPMTGLQVAILGSAIANDGLWPEPRFVRGHAARVGAGLDPSVGLHRSLSPETAHELLAAMSATTLEGGTAEGRFPEELRVAAKTGTSQRTVDGRRAQDAWVLALAPFDRPKVVVVVWLAGAADDSEDLRGGKSAAPVAATLVREATR